MASSMAMALKSLKRRRLRTAFTVSGIVVGVALILVLLSLTAGTSNRANGLINSLSPSQITVVNATGRTGGGPGGGGAFFFRGGNGGERTLITSGRGAGAAATFGALFGTGSSLPASITSAISNLNGVAVASPELSVTGFVNGTAAFLSGIDPTSRSPSTTTSPSGRL
jgi:hypothetical protein